jgi:hypothetical protein
MVPTPTEAEICVWRGIMAAGGNNNNKYNNGGNDDDDFSDTSTGIQESHHVFVHVLHVRQTAIARKIQSLGEQHQ